MIPSIDERIDSMIRVMTILIIPALQETLAIEQAKLLVGHLHAIRQQADYFVAYEMLEYRALRSLAEELYRLASGGTKTTTAARELLCALNGCTIMRPSSVRVSLEALNSAIELLVRSSREDGESEFRAKLRDRVVNHGNAAADRSRSWFSVMGFEPAVALAPIPDMIRAFEAELELSVDDKRIKDSRDVC